MAKVLRTGEVAKILGLPPRTVTELAGKKVLPAFERWGSGHYRYPADQIMELKERWSQSTEIGLSSLQPERGRSEVGIDFAPETDYEWQPIAGGCYEDSPVAQFLPLVRVVARSGMKGGVYGGELEASAASPVLGRREKRQNPPLPSFLKRHIEFMERIVYG